MVRKIGTVTAMVTFAVLMSPMFAMAQDAATAARAEARYGQV